MDSGQSAKPQAHFFAIELADGASPPPLEEVEQAYVRRVLEHTGGKRMAAAQMLGISYPTFLKRLRELGIDDAVTSVRRRAPSGARLTSTG
jgi:DNA-binding NtrC family response regulator